MYFSYKADAICVIKKKSKIVWCKYTKCVYKLHPGEKKYLNDIVFFFSFCSLFKLKTTNFQMENVKIIQTEITCNKYQFQLKLGRGKKKCIKEIFDLCRREKKMIKGFCHPEAVGNI